MENQFMNKEIQKSLMRLISEEWYAYQLYTFSALAAPKDCAETVRELFAEISEDELGDHMKGLVAWCRQYDYAVPCEPKDFAKYAGKNAVKLLDAVKPGRDACYYIRTAIESEKDALESYKAAIEEKGVSQFTDLQALLWGIYYDEAEHLSKLSTALTACEAGVDLCMD